MFAGIFSCTPSFSPEINKVYLILSYLIIIMPDIKYVGALPLKILNMLPSIKCSTLYSIGSSPTCLNSLAPTWNLHGAFNTNLIILLWVHCILHFNLFDNPLYQAEQV